MGGVADIFATIPAAQNAPIEVAPRLIAFPPSGNAPNNALLPAVVYYGALAGASAKAVEALLIAHRWCLAWSPEIDGRDMFRTNAHEVLVCVAGRARLRIGGAAGKQISLGGGDALVLPAGVARSFEAATADLQICAAVPEGAPLRDIRPADDVPDPAGLVAIARTPRPATDPLYGAQGPLPRLWRLPKS